MAFLRNFYYYVTTRICLWNQLIMAVENLSPLLPPNSSMTKVHDFNFRPSQSHKNS
jgi:hypothetical protein